MKTKVSEVKPRIFLIEFDNQYDCNMTFLRYQEFYESPNKKFRGKSFKIVDFMEWYSKDRADDNGDANFTYTTDWLGFNLPGKVIRLIYELGIEDRNKYDDFMWKHYSKFFDKYPDEKFYIIGSKVGDKKTIAHELAHGLFSTNEEYRKIMKKLVASIPEDTRENMYDALIEIGYCKQVLVDECQAYLATESDNTLNMELNMYSDEIDSIKQDFVNIYNKFVK
jgi:hypothetical protein